MNIQINNFTKKYRNTSINIKGLDLHKRLVVIKGENGAGKSTLLKAIASLIQYEGDIITPHTMAYLSEKIVLPSGVLLDEFIHMFLRENRYDVSLFEQLLKSLKLEDQLQKDISELSKGMTMKVQLLVVLSIEKELYILDEPWNGLDKESSKVLLDVIKHSKKSFLITSHLNHSLRDIDYQEVLL